MDWLAFSPVISDQLSLQGIDPTWWTCWPMRPGWGVSGLVAWLAARKGLNGGIVFVISAAISPVAGLLYALLIKDHAAEAGVLAGFGKARG